MNTNSIMISLKGKILLTIVWFSVQISNGQLIPIPELEKKYTFVKEDLNVISNNNELNSLMEKLYQLKSCDTGVINILHIGDSHLQADFASSVIRTTLQKSFGNGGRGLVVPFRVAKTNEPFNYTSSSSYLWQSKRCVFPNQPLPIGIGGVTISTDDSCADFTLKIKDDTLPNYGFNKMRLFYQKDSASYNLDLLDSLGTPVGISVPDSTENYPYILTTTFPSTIHCITVRARKSNEQQSKATIYGIHLENGSSGIIYNTVGVNGAEFEHYSIADHFTEQSKALKPDLIIFSLGTNEAFSANFTQTQFYSDIEVLFGQLKCENPDAEFLITTPACSFRRRKPNPRLPLAAKSIIQFATDNKIAYWDMQGATGGKNSANYWKQNHMLRRDGVHFSRVGYVLQGDLFCQAILNAYNSYVTNRIK